MKLILKQSTLLISFTHLHLLLTTIIVVVVTLVVGGLIVYVAQVLNLW